MTSASLVAVASEFKSASEKLHERFLKIRSDESCADCPSAAFGEAILTAWTQSAWGEFAHNLLVSSASGAQRADGTYVAALVEVATAREAEVVTKQAARAVAEEHGLGSPVWHAPWFVVKVGARLQLSNLGPLDAALGTTLVPGQITTVRNVLVHPGTKTQQQYEALQAKLGMLGVAPQHLPRQIIRPGVLLFTSWIRELQSVADGSIQ